MRRRVQAQASLSLGSLGVASQGGATRSRLPFSALQARAGAPRSRPKVRNHGTANAQTLRRIFTNRVTRVCAATLCACFLHQSGTCAAQCSPVRTALPPLHVCHGSAEIATRLAEAIFSDMLRSSPLAPYVEVRLLRLNLLFDRGHPH